MKILFVDDDKDAVEWVADVLVDYAGHSLKKIQTVSEARSALSVPKWEYDLFIIDVQIRPGPNEPFMSEEDSIFAGIELYREFRSRFPTAKALILTNNAYRLPTAIWAGDRYVRVCDKVEVSGLKLLTAISKWDK